MNILNTQISLHSSGNYHVYQLEASIASSSKDSEQKLTRAKRAPSLPVNTENPSNNVTQTSSTGSGVTIRCINESRKPSGSPNGASSADQVTTCQRGNINVRVGQTPLTP